ncbi:hypothetical protein [uncultured Pseudoramibacter sp.]|nr:hypothetical protein [uncultured Pseudoramibacter sp.]
MQVNKLDKENREALTELLEILTEAENDVKNGCVKPVSETFDALREML